MYSRSNILAVATNELDDVQLLANSVPVTVAGDATPLERWGKASAWFMKSLQSSAI